MDVVGVGTNSADEVLRLPVEPQAVTPGKAEVAERLFLPGGQTATVLAACAALELRARYVGSFGSDEAGRAVADALARRGVDLSHAQTCDAPNRSAVILVGPSGQRTVFWHRSARLKMPLESVEGDHLLARCIHVDDDDPDLALHVARWARRHRVPVTSDLEHPSAGVEALVRAVTVPMFEESLGRALAGERDPERMLRRLRPLNEGVLVVTLGDRGAAALDGDRFVYAPAYRVSVIDSTGAGDVFRAGFIHARLRGCSLADTLRFANAAAGASCTRAGAIPSVPSLAEVQALLASGALISS